MTATLPSQTAVREWVLEVNCHLVMRVVYNEFFESFHRYIMNFLSPFIHQVDHITDILYTYTSDIY